MGAARSHCSFKRVSTFSIIVTMKQIIKFAIALSLIVSCKSEPLNQPGIPQGTSVQEWPVDSVDPSTLEPAFNDDTIGQAEYIKLYGR